MCSIEHSYILQLIVCSQDAFYRRPNHKFKSLWWQHQQPLCKTSTGKIWIALTIEPLRPSQPNPQWSQDCGVSFRFDAYVLSFRYRSKHACRAAKRAGVYGQQQRSTGQLDGDGAQKFPWRCDKDGRLSKYGSFVPRVGTIASSPGSASGHLILLIMCRSTPIHLKSCGECNVRSLYICGFSMFPCAPRLRRRLERHFIFKIQYISDSTPCFLRGRHILSLVRVGSSGARGRDAQAIFAIYKFS